MNIDLKNRLYINNNKVYLGTTELNVHNQRGRLFIKYKGKQVNIKHIPLLPTNETDCVFEYIFNGGVIKYPCSAMEYWIYKHRLKHKITAKEYKQKFEVKYKRLL